MTLLADPDPDDDLCRFLRAFREGDPSARDKLIEHTTDRFWRLTRRMLAGYPDLRGLEETDDVFQAAMYRLVRALKKVRPESSVHFLRLGALQIRRELVDLARHHFGPNGAAAHAHFGEPPDGTDSSSSASGGQENQPPDDRGDGPSTLAEWTEFHEAVSAVPEELMAVVDLLLYQGLSQPQVARELGVDVRTVRRRWRAARRALAKWLADGPPGGKGHE